jgi:hypothetical protein
MAQNFTSKERIEWMWKANSNPWSPTEPSEWRLYSDVETAIIEEAFQSTLRRATLDDYHLDLKNMLQISNKNGHNQRPIKRMVRKSEAETRLREERFMSNSILPATPFVNVSSETFVEAVEKHFGFECNYPIEDATRRMLLKKAAKGLIIEGANVGKQKEGEWMAQQLLKVKKGTPKEVYQCCAYLYCLESFLYKNMNKWMRLLGNPEHELLWQAKVSTFGPFAYLLNYLKEWRDTRRTMTLYRGANLSNDIIEQFRQQCGGARFAFPAFTSTSRNRAKAEQFGNVLFVIDIYSKWDTEDVSSYSYYPHEEEDLLNPNFSFYIRSCTFDETKNKWLLHLQA